MPKNYTNEQVIEMIRKAVKVAGTQTRLAAEWNITDSYLSDILNGRRIINETIAGKLGLVSAGWVQSKETK